MFITFRAKTNAKNRQICRCFCSTVSSQSLNTKNLKSDKSKPSGGYKWLDKAQSGQMGPNGPVGRVRVGKSTGGSRFSCKTSLGVKTLFFIGTIASSNGCDGAIWGVSRVLLGS